MSYSSFFKFFMSCFLFLGLVVSLGCGSDPQEEDRLFRDERDGNSIEELRERREERRANRQRREELSNDKAEQKQENMEEESKNNSPENDLSLDIGVVNVEKVEENNSVTSVVNNTIILNMDESNVDNYELWECKKEGIIISYFLNKNPDTIDDEGTDRQRKRVCELFSIKSVQDNEPEVRLLYWAHHQKDWCEKNLNETLALHESEDERGGEFRCSQFEDLSFLF